MNFKNFHMQTFTLLLLFCGILADKRTPKKRQIYREQVLPHAGGRIPDTAFETDRLFLNRLQKEGIAIPDGIVPEQRNPQVYQYYHKSPRTVYHIALSSDGRYTPNEGKYHYDNLPTVETTYLYPQIHGQQVVLTPPTSVYPIYRQFQLHNPQLNQVKLQAKKKLPAATPNAATAAKTINGNGSATSSSSSRSSSSSSSHSISKARTKPYRTESYQNFNLLNIPLSQVGATGKVPSRDGKNYYLPNYNTAHLFNDFDEIFNKFDIDESGAIHY